MPIPGSFLRRVGSRMRAREIMRAKPVKPGEEEAAEAEASWRLVGGPRTR